MKRESRVAPILDVLYLAFMTHEIRFPGETAKYRKARDELLRAENELTRKVWAVAKMRRELPPGGRLKEDYAFEEVVSAELAADEPVRKVKLSELFLPEKDTLAIYNFMYSADMDEPCPMCTSFIDGMNGTVRHATQRMGVAIVAKSPIARIRGFARGRGWTNLRLLSSANNTYNHDYHGETEKGDQNPILNIFRRKGKAITHFWSSEQHWDGPDPKSDSCHLDMLWPLWNLLDLTPEGRGKFYTSLDY